MPRTRWLVVGFLLAAALVGGLLNGRGPFDQHPSLTYARFLADFQAGGVEQIVQWRNQLEVAETAQVLLVTVPPNRDVTADLAQARQAGGVGINFAQVPDPWLWLATPAVPILILIAGVLIWVASIARNRRIEAGSNPSESPQATR